MFEILCSAALGGIIVFACFVYLKWREEAKREGYIYDDRKEDQ